MHAGVEADPDSDDCSVAVIITNWNYAHFLSGCIECVLSQTIAPTEIIVVDDGSTDGSAAVLAAYTDRIQIIRKPNGGQASAFNAGFARSTSPVVVFLDADDLLRPEAVETILTWWHPGLSYLSFRLELIDVDGRSRGIYEETLRTDEGDKRQRLLTRGVFAFSPTSGNAFSRSFLDEFLPLDEKRWRISADLPLIYAAALHGPCVVLPHVLGAYRTHGGNNYYRERVPDAWRLHRGMRDVGDALELLADRQHRQSGPRADRALLELALRFSALRMQAKLQTLQGNEGDLYRSARRHLNKVLTSALPLGWRLIAAVPFATMGWAGWRSSTLRRWIEDPRSRPAILHAITASLRKRNPEGVLARLAGLERTRWPSMASFGVMQAPDFNGPMACLMAEGWSGEMSDTLHWTRAPEACLEFRLDATPCAVRLDISLVMGRGFIGKLVAVETMIGKRRLTVDHIRDHGTIRIDLSRDMIDEGGSLRLRLACSVVSPTSFWRDALAPEPFFAIRSWRASPLKIFPPFPLLGPGIYCGLGRMLPSDPVESGWQADASGIAWMIQSEATCRIAVAPCSDPVVLTLTLAPTQASGWLRITCDDAPLFFGKVISGAELQCLLPPVVDPDQTGLELMFAFAASDPTDTARVGIGTVGLIMMSDAAIAPGLPGRTSIPRINIGERIDLAGKAGRNFAIGMGWDFTDETGLNNLELEASFAFRIPVGCVDPVVHLAIEPLLPEPNRHSHIVAVSADHGLLVSARVQGLGDLEVALPQAVIQANGDVKLTLHSVFVPEASTGSTSALPMFAGVKVRSISFSARPPATLSALPSVPHTYAGSELTALATMAGRTLTSAHMPTRDGLRDIRRRLAVAIWRADDRALESQLVEPAFLNNVEAFGTLAESLPFHADEASLLAEIEAIDPVRGTRLRRALCAMLLRPARTVLKPDLMRLPTPLLWSIGPMARFSAMKPYGAKPVSANAATGLYCEELLGSILVVLRDEPRMSARYRMAILSLEEFGPGFDPSLLAQDTKIHRLWALCVELHLSKAGCALAAASARRSLRQRIRIGLLIRDTSAGPESGILFGIGDALDRDRFEPLLITLNETRTGIDPTKHFESVTDLMDAPAGDCAARLRALDLDIVLILTTLDRLDKMAAVAAHRLAPLQILLPGGPGLGAKLRSLSGTPHPVGRKPGAVTKSVVLGPATLPCVDVFAAAAGRLGWAAVERPLRVPQAPGIVMLGRVIDVRASLAVCELWVRVLAGAPESALIIEMGPAASGEQTETAWVQGLIRLACRRLDVAPERVTFRHLAASRSPDAEVEPIDLYLGQLDDAVCGLLRAVQMDIPCVIFEDDARSPHKSYGWAECLHNAGLVADTAEAYVRIAVSLTQDAARRRQRVEDLRHALTAPSPASDDGREEAFNRALLALVADSGLLDDRADAGP